MDGWQFALVAVAGPVASGVNAVALDERITRIGALKKDGKRMRSRSAGVASGEKAHRPSGCHLPPV